MLWLIAKEAAAAWSRHKDARQGAALAYYSVFALGPIIVIAIAIAGFVFSRATVADQILNSITGLIGDTGAKVVQAMLTEAGRPREGAVASALALGALAFAAIGLVVQLKDALNIVWETGEPAGHGLWHVVRSYVIALVAVLSFGFVMLASLIATTGLAAISKYSAQPATAWGFQLTGILVSLVLTAVLFAMMFKWLPDAAVDWRDVWLGATTTAVLFEIGKSAIAFYIGKQGLESTYGAAASIVVLLIWVYYTSQIILLGAEITHAFAKHHGSIKARSKNAPLSGSAT